MLCYELNTLIKRIAPKYTASSFAPDTFERLYRSTTSGLVVWDGASDNTIYGDATVNHAFRAWHDSLHLKLNADFTLKGEYRVACKQASQLGDGYARIIMAEIEGQARYFEKYGQFPTDQLAFILQYIKTGKV
jgi:hypothetical protein